MTSAHATRIRLAASVAALTAVLAACSSGGSSGSAAGNNTAGSTAGALSQAGTASTPVAAPTSSTAAASTSSTDVCALLTSAQASSINHVTYGAATPKTIAPGWDKCTYKNGGKADSPVDIQDLTVDVQSMPGCWASLEKTPNRDKPVSGIGDAAFGYRIGLAVKDGSRCVQVEGLTFAELGGDYSRDVAMAKIVMGKLH